MAIKVIIPKCKCTKRAVKLLKRIRAMLEALGIVDGWRVIEDIVARAKEKLTVRETEGVALPLVKKAFEKV